MGEKLKKSKKEVEKDIDSATKEAVEIFEKYWGPFSEEKYNEVEKIVREILQREFKKVYGIIG